MRNRGLAIMCAIVPLILALVVPTPVGAQQYEPTVGQEGKDVIWWPTPDELITAMLDMAKVTPNDYVIDLGSGDGRIVIAAARRGARALGVEYNPDMVELSKHNAEKAGVTDKASFIRADIFETDFSGATVLTMYLLPDLNLRLRPKILDMKPGTRVVSHAFAMEDWEPDNTASADSRTAYFWIVPAKAAGTWSWQTASGKAELKITQVYQKIEGSLQLNSRELPLKNAKLEGDRIRFAIEESNPKMREYSGRVNGNAIEGTTKAGNSSETKWTAERLQGQ